MIFSSVSGPIIINKRDFSNPSASSLRDEAFSSSMVFFPGLLTFTSGFFENPGYRIGSDENWNVPFPIY